MTRPALVLLQAAALAAAPLRLTAQREAHDLASWTSVADDPSLRHAVGATILAMPRNPLAPGDDLTTRPAREPVSVRTAVSTASVATRVVPRSWSSTHIALASAFTVALLVDAAQTRSLARQGWPGFQETNPLLGPFPSVGRVNTYTAVAGLSVLAVAAAAPPRARSWVLGVALVVEALTVGGNVRSGLPLRFP
jgi:hypothetical protein